MIEVSLILTGQEVKIISPKIRLNLGMRWTVDLIKIDLVKIKMFRECGSIVPD